MIESQQCSVVEKRTSHVINVIAFSYPLIVTATEWGYPKSEILFHGRMLQLLSSRWELDYIGMAPGFFEMHCPANTLLAGEQACEQSVEKIMSAFDIRELLSTI